MVPPVVPVDVRAEQPFHPRDQIGLGSFNYQVKVVAHQAIGVHLPASLFARLGQSLKESLSILDRRKCSPVGRRD